MAAELGQQTVEFSALVGRAAEESFLSLKELVEKSRDSDQSDTEKKINILKYIVKTQQRMLRLNVLAKWCQQNPLIQYCQQLGSTLSSHDTCFTQAADSLFFMHEGLQQARAPVYDVPSAIDILLTGSYQRMPKCVEDVGTQSTLTEEEQKPALRKLDTLVRCKILEVSIPKEISEVKISDGTAMVRVNGEFKVLVTLGYRGHLSLWRILHLELLVGERSGLIKMEEMRRHVLGDDLERRMAAAENPFTVLYSVLHELCVALVMDTVIRQVQALRQGRWRDAIRFELISDGSSSSSQTNQEGEPDQSGLRTPGLKILYWLDLDKNCHIKIEPGSDLQIKCLHSTFVIDPLTGKEAEFSLDQSCIDVERLLLRAICCHRYTRLLEIQKDLGKNSQISRASGDVVLQSCVEETDIDSKGTYKAPVSEYEEGQEVLRVRAYGSSFFTLGVSIRTGRYILQSSQNIIESPALLECEDALNQGSMNAAEVFISLRSKSILHLFASISKFLGLEVYEHGLPAIKLPKSILNGSAMLLMGFPDCGSSYFLLLQLDKDFNPLFNLLEANTEQLEKGNSSDEQNRVVYSKKLDMNQMQMLEGEMNLSLLEWGKSLSFLTIQTSASALPSELSFVGENRIPLSSFASVVDEVFGQSIPIVSSQFNPSSVSHFGSLTGNLRAIKSGTRSPKWEGSLPYGGPLLPSSKLKGSVQSNSHGSLSSVPGRSSKLLSSSKSEQDLASLRSPQSGEFGSSISMDDTSKESIYGASAQLLSPPRPNSSRVSGSSLKANGPRILPSIHLTGSLKVAGSSPISQAFDSAVCNSSSYDVVSKQDRKPRKRTLSDMLDLVPSLKGVDTNSGPFKRKRISEAVQAQKASSSQALLPIDTVSKIDGYNYGNLIAEANKGNTPSGIYVSALLHVVRHCSVDIKHARLTSQMEALDIPYVEETGFRSASSNIWLRLPFARDDTWKHICLRLGRPGSMSWDVKINDQHFMDLWELQKGNGSTPWGSGVRIANTSDIDSHIRYDPEGVVLSYQSVESDSVKKLVADVQRLSNARVFALGMRRLLGVRADEKAEEISDVKAPVDRLSEQMRRAFRIEAVGLTSLWFGFVSGVVARFVVEWESGKEGCTMHVFPDQLWPHTKFLEDFINGAEIASLLDCIRLTAGPLNALSAATRPARAGPIQGVPGAAHTIYPQSLPKQTINVNPSNTGVNPAATTATSPLTNHTLHGAAMLAAASRGGPGIVPSALLPIDVSVVLRGPYWIRIIYRKHFAVDMRCFAGDQVWLQPATPPRGGPSVGGSLPCPQFRPFIMEHVAQELNVLEPNFAGQSPTLPNSQSQHNSVSALSAANGNRIGAASSAAILRTANPVAGLNRMGTAPLGSTSNLAVLNSGMPIRRLPGVGVPAHVRGELNTAIIGLGDDGGYGGGWVPHVALKKVLRGILKYLGVLWLFAQLPELLKEILGSILKDNEGTLLNLDQEQPALRFFVGGYVFAVSVHRVQLLLQVLSVKRFHHQQQQQQQNSATAQEELTQTEIGEICDYFSRRVASEPYDASRVASFITLLTLPISVLREFLKLIAWKKGLAQAQGGDMAPAQKPRIELCLENHMGLNMDGSLVNSSVAKSNIHYDRPHNWVDFALTVVLDSAHIPHINVAGGAAWLPYCVSVRLRYSFGDSSNVSFLGMDGSHGGRSCWFRVDDWEKCKQRVSRTVEANGCLPSDNTNQGRLRLIADSVQRTLNLCLQGLREGAGGSASTVST